MTRALIVGRDGQDSRLLYDLLASRGAAVVAAGRRGARSTAGSAGPLDAADGDQVRRHLDSFAPDEVYYLAAHHSSSADAPEEGAAEYRLSHDVNVLGLIHFLDGLRARRSSARLFYASSSRVFGAPKEPLVDESSPLAPLDHYGLTKAAGMLACRAYREAHGVYASVGILFNHESELRDPRFVSRKVVRAAAECRRDRTRTVELGDLDAVVDWGAASDYVEAMSAILGLPEPGDYVVASGRARTVRDFAEEAFKQAGLDWRDHVRASPGLARKRPAVIGDPSRLRRAAGWAPRTSFSDLVRRMLAAEGVGTP